MVVEEYVQQVEALFEQKLTAVTQAQQKRQQRQAEAERKNTMLAQAMNEYVHKMVDKHPTILAEPESTKMDRAISSQLHGLEDTHSFEIVWAQIERTGDTPTGYKVIARCKTENGLTSYVELAGLLKVHFAGRPVWWLTEVRPQGIESQYASGQVDAYNSTLDILCYDGENAVLGKKPVEGELHQSNTDWGYHPKGFGGVASVKHKTDLSHLESGYQIDAYGQRLMKQGVELEPVL